ncbi:flagellar biosynthesis protein FlhF [Cohnella sp. WQ 127256]|uniref:flagellar biosynthesis protein FlhF n=1 Tax=Cohnella sp. WQ 127256 TaxID=2938790 RepID=UPI00211880FE|nr:flagellar biosynthesis protein FlhF [Cohnella sp. WQ 127256]
MKVKRYIVDDVSEAVNMIRNELGSDAFILNTKEIRIGGFLGMFRKKRVEVTAAVDEAAIKPSKRPMLPVRQPERKSVPTLTEEPSASSPLLPSNAIRERYSQAPFADSGRKPSLPSTDLQMDVDVADPLKPSSESIPFYDKQSATLAAVVQTIEEARDKKQQSDESSELLQELRTMKEMMAKMARQQTYRSMPESVMKWSKRLAEQGVEPSYVEQFAEAVNQRLQEQGDEGIASSYEASQEVLLSWLQHVKGNGVDSTTRIIHFVGPTGVGKTTTIAKLAAEQSLNHRRSVGLITADTYRIAAVDQLRTYADILNIPLEVVFSPSELVRAYKKLSDLDLIFMDTAGRNYRNELFVSEVNSLLSPGEQTETILVLSMTHKISDMKMVASQFVKYGVNQLLLTKFDETDSFGAVINLVKEFDFRISYITFGQAVPDDIRPFDPKELVKRLLGDPADD